MFLIFDNKFTSHIIFIYIYICIRTFDPIFTVQWICFVVLMPNMMLFFPLRHELNFILRLTNHLSFDSRWCTQYVFEVSLYYSYNGICFRDNETKNLKFCSLNMFFWNIFDHKTHHIRWNTLHLNIWKTLLIRKWTRWKVIVVESFQKGSRSLSDLLKKTNLCHRSRYKGRTIGDST